MMPRREAAVKIFSQTSVTIGSFNLIGCLRIVARLYFIISFICKNIELVPSNIITEVAT